MHLLVNDFLLTNTQNKLKCAMKYSLDLHSTKAIFTNEDVLYHYVERLTKC